MARSALGGRNLKVLRIRAALAAKQGRREEAEAYFKLFTESSGDDRARATRRIQNRIGLINQIGFPFLSRCATTGTHSYALLVIRHARLL
jgi:hypothetical protein